MGEDRIVICPGPVHIHDSIINSIYPAYHRTDEFRKIYLETERMLADLINTDSPVYILAASGTGAMEAAAVNIAAEGAKVLVVSGGKFGDRWESIYSAFNCEVLKLGYGTEEKIDIARISLLLDEFRPEIIAITHVETSTGVLFPLEEFVSSLGPERPLLTIDAVASIGAEKFLMDDWGIDVTVSAAQKALAASAGVSFLSLSERAFEVMKKSSRSRFYFGLDVYETGRENGDAPFTPAIQAVQMLHHSLKVQSSSGWDVILRRHKISAERVVEALGHFGMASMTDNSSSAVQVMLFPAGVDGSSFIKDLAEKQGVVAAGGQGALEGRVLRLGFTGLYSGATLQRIVRAIGEQLGEYGLDVDIEAAEKSINPILDREAIF